MPTRTVTLGGGFNMTPSEELFARSDFLPFHDIPNDIAAEALALFARGYQPESLASGNA